MSSIIGLAIFIADVVAIIDAVKSSMTTGKKVLWILLILILPLVGLALYFFIGRKK
jgi:hypothetical protein